MVEVNTPGEENSFYGAIHDLEENQRNLKDRLILIGQNLIEFRDKTEEEILNLKKEIEILKNGLEKIKDFIESMSGEINKYAKKEDLEILTKQAKMFQPFDFVKKSDLEKLKNKGHI